MASYAYPANPVVPNQDQQSYPTYNQWGGQSAAVPPPPTNTYAGYDQQNTYGANQANSYSSASGGDYNNSYSNNQSYGGGYQQKGNFRGGNNRNSGPGFNKGPRGNFGGSGSSGIEEQQDTIFVSGISENTTESDLLTHFGSIGIIKIDKKTRKEKIWVYKDKETGKPKGECTITYDDPAAAPSAISWFNGKDLNGATLKVELAQRKNNFLGGNSGGGNRNNNFSGNRNNNRDFDRNKGGSNDGGRRVDNSQGGGPPREGDWVCGECQNNNFAWRDSCNRCKTSRPNAAGGGNEDSGSDRRGGNLPYERRGGNQSNGSFGGPRADRGGFGGPRNNNNGNRNQNRSFGGRNNDQRGGPRNGGGPMRGSDNRRNNPY